MWAGGANLGALDLNGVLHQSGGDAVLAEGGHKVISHGDILPNTTNLNLGSDTKRWADIFVGDVRTTNIIASGSASFGGIVGVFGDLEANQDFKVDGDTIIGTGNSDSLRINADLESSITLNADNTYYLGNSSRGFRNIYAREITIKDKIKTDDIEIDGTLNHDGVFAGFFGKSPVVRQDASEFNISSPYDPTSEKHIPHEFEYLKSF